MIINRRLLKGQAMRGTSTSQIALTWMNHPGLIAFRDPISGVLLMAGL